MAPITSHKYYVFMLVAAVIVSLGVIFDFDARRKIEHYNPQGIAHYDLPYDIFPPTARLLKISFLDSIEKFPNRNTIVLIGNSVVAGAGAKDRVFFSSSLQNDNFNVINAGLNGEYLSASSALAVLGIDANISNHPSAFHHIFVVYPPTRLYDMGSYWTTGTGLMTLAQERNISSYLWPYSIEKEESIAHGIQSIIFANMRCVINRNIVITAIKNLDWYCEEPFAIQNSNPGFIKEYARPVGAYTDEDRKDLSAFMSGNTFIDSAAERNGKVNNIAAHVAPLERFLMQKGVRHKLYFLLLRDSPAGVRSLPKQRQNEYDLGRTSFLKELAYKMPDWEILDAPQMTDSSFFDATHLREDGQAEIATLIKKRITYDQATRH